MEAVPIKYRSPTQGFPRGWYRIAESSQIKNDVMTPVSFLNEQFIVYRTQDGSLKVADAYCPHLGAHLASHTGSLRRDLIVCPFHNWRWDAVSGRCVEIPYCATLPKVSLKMHVACERDGMVLLWYHPDGAAPDCEPPELNLHARPDLVPCGARSWTSTAPFRDVLENFFDIGHVVQLHGYIRPTVEACESLPHSLRLVLQLNYSLEPQMPNVKMNCHFSGVTLLHQHFDLGCGDLFVLHSFTPVDEESFRQDCRLFITNFGSVEESQAFGRDFAERFYFDVEQDMKVLNVKKHLREPVLCAGDGPIMKFRRYQDQFYS